MLDSLIFYLCLWRDINHALAASNDLERLMKWAKRKKLSGPYKAYKWQRQQITLHLIGLKAEFPRFTKWAYRFYRLNDLFRQSPRYWRKGSAAKYRRNDVAIIAA